MPAIAFNNRQYKSSDKKQGAQKTSVDLDLKVLALLALHGALLGLSAPGFDQFYLAWFGLVPLLFATVSSSSPLRAFLRGTVFGIAYNLVYFTWYLGLQPLDWLGFNQWEGWALAIAAWMFNSTHQGLVIGLFALALRLLPITGSFLPASQKGKWQLPALIAVPLLWELIVNKLANAHSASGVPWSMLEYSQYHQTPLIQIASIIGGIGLGFVMVMANTAVAAWLAAFLKRRELKPIAAPSRTIGVYQLITMALILGSILSFGYAKLAHENAQPETIASILQGNINIDMQKTKHRYTLPELASHYTEMVAQCPKGGLIVWTESALPTSLSHATYTQEWLTQLAKARSADMVVGAIDRDDLDHPFNSAFGVTSDGRFLANAYHKRYLVPFGEYTPMFLRNMPEWLRRLTNTPAGGGFESGTQAVVLPLNSGPVAPLICFETLSPELVADSVRHGGQLLVNISDLAWFHRSAVGQQMIAFSVMRAVENNRYLVFTANTGPSAIINSSGKIVNSLPQDGKQILSGKVSFIARETPFTRWFIF